MASTLNKALADRLRDHAQAIENPAAHQAEEDLREAADLLESFDAGLIPRLTTVLRRTADHCTDQPVKLLLYGLIGHKA